MCFPHVPLSAIRQERNLHHHETAFASPVEAMAEAKKPYQLDRTHWPCSRSNSSACRFPQHAPSVSPTDTDAGPNHFIGDLGGIHKPRANVLPIVCRLPLLVPT